jgi:hypothetical protein
MPVEKNAGGWIRKWILERKNEWYSWTGLAQDWTGKHGIKPGVPQDVG